MVRYEKVVSEGLGFDKAMEALLDNKKVSRAIWEGYWEIRETEFGMLIVAELKSGHTAIASPYQEDLLSFDWRIVE